MTSFPSVYLVRAVAAMCGPKPPWWRPLARRRWWKRFERHLKIEMGWTYP